MRYQKPFRHKQLERAVINQYRKRIRFFWNEYICKGKLVPVEFYEEVLTMQNDFWAFADGTVYEVSNQILAYSINPYYRTTDRLEKELQDFISEKNGTFQYINHYCKIVGR